MTAGDATKAHVRRSGVRGDDGIEVSLGRWLGRAARWATHEMDSFAEWTQKIASTPNRSRPRPVAARPPLEVLVAQLVELVEPRTSEHAASLAKDPAFWSLIAKLYVRRPPLQKRAPNARAQPKPKTAMDRPVAAGQDADAAPVRATREALDATATSDPEADVASDGTQAEPTPASALATAPVVAETRSAEESSSPFGLGALAGVAGRPGEPSGVTPGQAPAGSGAAGAIGHVPTDNSNPTLEGREDRPSATTSRTR